jgi:hypothetical protein
MNRTPLAEETARKLYAARIAADDPGLVQLREWNAAVAARGELAGVTGSTNRGTPSRRATEAPASGYGSMGPTFASPLEAVRPQKNSAPAPLRAESASTHTTESDWDLVALALAGGATGPSHQPEPSWPRPSSTSNTGADDNTRTSG